MSNIRENFDLDGDNNISGKDIDVLWAFLQTKTLAEKEWADNVAKAPTQPPDNLICVTTIRLNVLR